MSIIETIPLQSGRNVYFASDFHLGVPTPEQSRIRERAVVAWLDRIQPDAEVIFLVGDVFDFWFEYKRSIPKGFIRLQGKLAELTDGGTKVVLFTGNHDMWMSDYFTQEMGIPVYREPRRYILGEKRFLVGHGDGLGPGDYVYKRLKVLFESGLARRLFRYIHPDVGIGLAQTWSHRSRLSNQHKGEEIFLGDDREWLMQYCREVEAQMHHDFYVFGHRHLPLDRPVSASSRYINLGEWVTAKTYARFDGSDLQLKTWTAID